MLSMDNTLRPGVTIQKIDTGEYFEIEGIDIGKVKLYGTDNKWHSLDDYQEIKLTPEILKKYMGFELTDMGDFWQAEKEDFIIIQPNLKLIEMQMPFIFALKSSINGSVSFRNVHHLQSTYLDLKDKVLEFQLPLTEN